MSVLVVMEQRGGEWNRMSFETLAAGQQIAKELGTTASAAVLGQGVAGLASELASKQLDKVWAVEHELLKDYTPDGYTAALKQLVAKAGPAIVLFPHTYQVRDFLPKLATALDRVAISDAVSHRAEGGQLTLVRQLFQGKVNVDVRWSSGAPNFGSLQAGAYRADQLAEGAAAVETFTPELAAADIRTRPLELFRDSARAVDLSAAEIIVSVGRGIKEADNLPLVEKL
jgi:electron transfer flavoprotein alpha subunit